VQFVDSRELRDEGAGIREIGREVNLHPEQVRRILARRAEPVHKLGAW
jgi:hypothetical protein